MATDFIIINGTDPGEAKVDLPINEPVQLTSLVSAATYEWVLVSQPEGSPQVQLDPHEPTNPIFSTAPACAFVPTKEGSYLIRLTLNAGEADESVDTTICAVRELQTGDRIPAPQETTEVNSDEGWAPGAVTKILQRVTRLSDSGIFVAQNASLGILQPGSVVHMNGMSTLGVEDNERPVPTIGLALASDPALVDGPLGIMLGSVAGAPISIANGQLCRVMVMGGLASYQGAGTGGTAGDPVYVSNTGTLSLTAGTTVRQVGDVAKVIADGDYDIAISAGANSIPRGNAAGDLSGMYPDPTVAKINGTSVPTGGTIGAVLQMTDTDQAQWEPLNLAYTDSVTGTLPITRGGTGTSSVTLTLNGLIYADTTTSMGVLAPGTSGYLLKSNGAGSAPSWIQTVPISSGGTGQLNALTAGGFIYAGTTSAMACTTAGVNGQLITSTAGGAPAFLGQGSVGHVLRSAGAGAAPSFGQIQSTAFAQASIPYNAIQSNRTVVDYTGIYSNATSTFTTFATVAYTAVVGLVDVYFQPIPNGSNFVAEVTSSLNNHSVTVFIQYVVTGPPTFVTQTLLYTHVTPYSTAASQLMGSMTLPPFAFLATVAGAYTVTASALVATPGDSILISNYRIAVQQG